MAGGAKATLLGTKRGEGARERASEVQHSFLAVHGEVVFIDKAADDISEVSIPLAPAVTFSVHCGWIGAKEGIVRPSGGPGLGDDAHIIGLEHQVIGDDAQG